MISSKYDELIIAILSHINDELDRCYWNANQKELNSPFLNTGEQYSNKVFKVRAYDWNGNCEPNFEYKDFKVWWYKHFARSTTAYCDSEVTVDYLADMLNECLKSIGEDFSEKH